MGEKQAAVHGIGSCPGKAHAFRMPLDGQNGEGGMDGRFYHAIRRALNNDEAVANPSEALMVRAVNDEFFSVKFGQNAVW